MNHAHPWIRRDASRDPQPDRVRNLALTLLSVFAAAWLGDTWHIWATGLQQALAIFWIAFGYFGARAIWSHALYRLDILDI